jgi:hypothetical protein
VWAGVLGDLDEGGSDRPRLLLNHRNPTVRRVEELTDLTLLALAVELLTAAYRAWVETPRTRQSDCGRASRRPAPPSLQAQRAVRCRSARRKV